MPFTCHDQPSTSVKIPNLIRHWWTLPTAALPPQHHCALAPPSSLMKSAWRWLLSLPPFPPPFPCLSVSSLDSNMPSSCISKQVQGRALPKPRQARGTRVARWLWHATDRRRQGQTIGGVSRWLFDFPGSPHNSSMGVCLWGMNIAFPWKTWEHWGYRTNKRLEWRTLFLIRKIAHANQEVLTHQPHLLGKR